MPKLKIAVVSGGTTHEHKASVRSAKDVMGFMPDAYDAKSYDSVTDLQGLVNEMLSGKIDVVFPLVHGLADDNGSIQGLCSILNIPYVGSNIHATALCQHKETAKRIIMTHGTLTPEFEILERQAELDLRQVQLPCVIKPGNVGDRVGVTIPYTYTELRDGIQAAFKHSERLLIEQLIEGKEFAVSLLGDQGNVEILPAVEIKRIGQSKHIQRLCPADLSSHQRSTLNNLARRAFQALQAEGMLLVRFMYNEESSLFYFIEANTIPALTQNSLLPLAAHHANISYQELIDRLIKSAIARNV